MTILKEYAELHNCSLYSALRKKVDDKLISSTNISDFIKVIEKYKSVYKEMELSDVLTAILQESGYEAMLRQAGEQERLDNLAELKQSVFEFEKTSGESNTVEEYLQNIALFSNADKEYEKESVKMMTIHTSKGLEFPYAFVCGLNEGIFPSKRVDTEDKLEEERRLAYVAYTRAENALFLSDSEGSNYDGSFRYPSRFIFNTDKAYLNYMVELETRLIDDASKFIKRSEEKVTVPITAFSIGDIVKHKVFGTGKVIEIKKDISSYVIKFDGSETERNLNFKAPLENVREVALSSNDTENKAEVEFMKVQEIENEKASNLEKLVKAILAYKEIQEATREEIKEVPETIEMAQKEEVEIQEPIADYKRQKKRGFFEFFRKK